MKWYKFNINDMTKAEYDAFLSLMNAEKRERVNRFKSEADKKLCVCGEMLAKRAVSEISGKKIEELVFEAQKGGKPVCKNADVWFSISHSGEYAVCAVSDRPVGIDIERIKPYNESIARRICTLKELEAIEKSGDKAREFIKIWTQKEAALKRDGKGVFSSGIKACLLDRRIETIEFEDYFVSICE
ncbi:MAG: 4'-phosphopantetheinyl transferase superfamily protein [Clostridia bacterium]|nr:4'-phosphopantetheinyl transferase superfamily protein [Clostridia bacterium]